MVEIRPATLGDLDGIMAVESETFGPVGQGAAATRETMIHRIRLLNREVPEWFFVACCGNRVVGDAIFQPTNLRPEDCTSWAAATSDGFLDSTFSRDGNNIYGVSLAVGRHAPPGTPELLLERGFLAWHSAGKGFLMFCSRMPGFASAHRKTGISAEDYMMKRRKAGGPRDPLLYLYWKWTGGAEPVRLLKDGYSVDSDSGGYGALFALDDPAIALQAIAIQLSSVSFAPGHASITAVEDKRMILPSETTEKIAELQGGERLWFDQEEQRMVKAATAYVAYGCPDWGAPNGIRKQQLCPFCILPDLAISFQERHFGGSMTSEDHLRLFEQVFDAILASVSDLHTLKVFNGGSFFHMPKALQEGIMRRIAGSGRVQRAVLEARAGLITAEALDPLLGILGETRLTVRIGVETKDHHLRTKRLPKGQSYSQLLAASAVMLSRGVTSGGYVLLNPAAGLSGEEMVREARSTIEWVLEPGSQNLGMQEVYFCAACVEPGTRLEEEWLSGAFRPARLWDVFDVLAWAVERYGTRVHLLPFEEALPYSAVPSNHVPQGIPQDLAGAQGCDLEFHRMLRRYRETMDARVLKPLDCSCRALAS